MGSDVDGALPDLSVGASQRRRNAVASAAALLALAAGALGGSAATPGSLPWLGCAATAAMAVRLMVRATGDLATLTVAGHHVEIIGRYGTIKRIDLTEVDVVVASSARPGLRLVFRGPASRTTVDLCGLDRWSQRDLLERLALAGWPVGGDSLPLVERQRLRGASPVAEPDWAGGRVRLAGHSRWLASRMTRAGMVAMLVVASVALGFGVVGNVVVGLVAWAGVSAATGAAAIGASRYPVGPVDLVVVRRGVWVRRGRRAAFVPRADIAVVEGYGSASGGVRLRLHSGDTMSLGLPRRHATLQRLRTRVETCGLDWVGA